MDPQASAHNRDRKHQTTNKAQRSHMDIRRAKSTAQHRTEGHEGHTDENKISNRAQALQVMRSRTCRDRRIMPLQNFLNRHNLRWCQAIHAPYSILEDGQGAALQLRAKF